MSGHGKPAEGWGAEPFFFTEAARGGPWLWRIGEPGLAGEPLGPVRHAHDDAGEYYYMHRGSGHVEAGGEEFVLEEGQLGFIPADAPHNFLGPASERDAEFFCVVAPNFPANKWRVKDFKPGSESLRMAVATPFVDDELPGGGPLSAHALELAPGDAPLEVSADGFEVVYLVVEGALDVALDGGLHGTLASGSYLHVREGIRHELSSAAGGRVLRMDCAFTPWQGIETAEDVR